MMVQRIPGLDKLGHREECTEHEAKASNNDVSDSEERIPPSHHRACGDEDRLCPVVDGNWKV